MYVCFNFSLQIEANEFSCLISYVMINSNVIDMSEGAIAASAATFVGHYPWFVVYNYLSTSLLSAEQFTDIVHHGTHGECTYVYVLYHYM